MELRELVEILRIFFEKYGYLTTFLGSFVEITPLGWVVPGGTILAIAGFFANGDSSLNLALIIISGTLGAWSTFLLAYLLGKKTGMWLVKKLHQEKNAAFSKRLLLRHGGTILTTSMMANLTRFWIAYIAGVENYKFSKFFMYSGIASLSWVSLMTIIGYIVGFERQNIESGIAAIGVAGWVFLGLATLAIQRSIKHEYEHFKKDVPHDENS
jgi:membrane-associated protein